MDGLPFLPGNNFNDPTKTRYHRSQSLGYKNGYRLPTRPSVGIGGEPIPFNGLSEQELDELANFEPTLTYGQAKQAPPSDFVPAHVHWDKKVLRFYGWYKQTVHESPDEHYRVRHVNLYYYLEDDSIAVVEPHVENSGMPQGKLIKRQRLPKNDVGDHWHWKDINIGFNITFYGKVFHLYDADKFTKDFLESEGIEVNQPEGYPLDPYIESRKGKAALRTYKTASDFDKLRQFLEMDRKVLRFFVVWDDRDNMFGEMRKFVLHYYLVDDTLEVRECHTANDGRDPFPVLISRHRCPKDRGDVDPSFSRIAMELTEQEIKEYFTPRDFAIGKTIHVLGRRFLLYDCDNFTKAFYWKNFNMTDFTPVDISQPRGTLPKMEVTSYNGYGSLEDSMQSCLSLIPQPPKKDFIKMLENDGKSLRYEAVLEAPRQILDFALGASFRINTDTNKPEDKGRRFIISYRLSDDMIVIYEPPVRNSGIIGGKFLERTRVAKPNSPPEKPVFYGPQDFYIGAKIEIFKHRFRIVNADLYVLNFMKEYSSQFPSDAVQSMEQTFASKGPADMTGGETQRAPGELAQLVAEIIGQIKKIAITASNRKDQMFLGINVDRNGCITKENLRFLCEKLHLPSSDDIIDALACAIGRDPEHITLEEMRSFFES